MAATYYPTSGSSDYIPRDDVTEAMRLKAFGAPGYGDVIYDDDPELNEAIQDLVAHGQVAFREEVDE